MTTASVVRLGILGSGSMARTRAANIAAIPQARLVLVASRNRDTGTALAQEHHCAYLEDVAAAYARTDLDALLICTHNAAHGEQAIAALHHGLHVLVEYPLALDPAQGAEALRLARQGRRALMVGYEQARLGPHQALGEAIARFGAPLSLRIEVQWTAATARAAFRNLQLSGSPGQIKSYYLYAALEWLGTPQAWQTGSRYRDLAADGSYSAALQRCNLDYADTLADLQWLVGPDPGVRQRVSIRLDWPDRTLLSDGRRLLERDALGERALQCVRLSWEEATARGLAAFLAAVRTVEPDLQHAERALLTARIAAG